MVIYVAPPLARGFQFSGHACLGSTHQMSDDHFRVLLPQLQVSKILCPLQNHHKISRPAPRGGRLGCCLGPLLIGFVYFIFCFFIYNFILLSIILLKIYNGSIFCIFALICLQKKIHFFVKNSIFH